MKSARKNVAESVRARLLSLSKQRGDEFQLTLANYAMAQGITAQAELDQAQSRYSAMQAAYENALYTTSNLLQAVEQFKAQVELQRKKLRDTTVRAPFNGYVKERVVNPGQFVRVGTALMTVRVA